MLVFVRALTGKTFTLLAEPSDTIADIKQKIDDKTGQPFDTIRLICAGKGLEDCYNLDHYNIKQYAIFFMVLRLRAG